MKILIIANMYPSKKFPSYGVFVKNHVRLLEEAGVAVETITMNKETAPAKKFIRYLQFYLQIVLALWFKKYTTIYIHYASHSALPILFAKALRPKLNLTVNLHGSDVFPETPFQEKLQKWVTRLLRKARHIVVPSAYFKSVVAERYTVSASKIVISPSGGVNRKLFTRLETPKADTFFVGYVGRIDTDKGWDDALYGFSEFKHQSNTDAKLIMVGSGKEDAKKEALIQKLGLEQDVICHSLLPQEKLVAIYNQMDVFVFPSRRKGESLGLVGIEAMACGVPVIGSQIAGIKGYLVEGKNGYFTEVGNPYSIAEKLLEFAVSSEENKKRLSDNAFQSAAPYDEERVKKHMLSFLPRISS
jgi:glycosyltransferase involved in cell wall biosynthesis